jgi:hypothetical protein
MITVREKLKYVFDLFRLSSNMNKLPLLVAFFACVLVGTAVSETQFEFPTEACATGLLTGTYITCISSLASSIWKIHQWGEDTPMTICGNACTGNLKGRFSSWEWKWDAKFQCQNKAQGIIGQSTALSRDGAMQGAIENWITQASQAGKVNVNDFKC